MWAWQAVTGAGAHTASAALRSGLGGRGAVQAGPGSGPGMCLLTGTCTPTKRGFWPRRAGAGPAVRAPPLPVSGFAASTEGLAALSVVAPALGLPRDPRVHGRVGAAVGEGVHGADEQGAADPVACAAGGVEHVRACRGGEKATRHRNNNPRARPAGICVSPM